MNSDFHLDTALFPRELSLLLSFIQAGNVESMYSGMKDELGEIDWDHFLQLAWHHRVFPVLYAKLQQMDQTWIPPYVIQALQKKYQKNTFQMLHFSAEMEQLCKLFSESNIRTLVLKGPVLAADLYGDISLRTSGDLDILIPIHDLHQAEKLLDGLGYIKDDYIQTVLNDWKWRHHHITFFHHQKKLKIEIHWRLSPGPGKEPCFNELWERKRTCTVTQTPAYYLGREDLFLFLVSHGARHGWSRLRWLMDIDHIYQQNINYAKLIPLLKKYHQLDVAAQALILASQLLNTPLSAEMSVLTKQKRPRRLAQDALFYIYQMLNLHNEPLPEHVARYHKRHLFNLMSIQQKMLFLASQLFPYPGDADTLALPPYLHFLYFPLRPFLWAWRKTKKRVVSQGGM
ncbi:nucleotidyltransferase domain-containing protein [Paenibacillus eucommiae]|uniref:Renal dipeptidase n=1 Tax=Paenibacillus eucommiae TaxID=1355755 RepID=A0ABS4IS41_9BACL|nr:nucleotidyltransferase family protein [Paenibacillus eucommiae]MBP1990381.1 hypothetical protein [Paenibacillus eucommiae]